MLDLTSMISQLELLLKEHASLFAASRCEDASDRPIESRALANRLDAAIHRMSPVGGTYVKQADLIGIEPFTLRLEHMAGIARALLEDLRAGWLDSVVELVHADTLGDFLEMSEELLSKEYKDPAAVIAGTSLEVRLRDLCTKHGVLLIGANGRPRRADAMNAELAKVGAYNSLEQKQVTSWLAIRNAAAHGEYGAYTSQDVRLLIEGVRSFALKHPA